MKDNEPTGECQQAHKARNRLQGQEASTLVPLCGRRRFCLSLHLAAAGATRQSYGGRLGHRLIQAISFVAHTHIKHMRRNSICSCIASPNPYSTEAAPVYRDCAAPPPRRLGSLRPTCPIHECTSSKSGSKPSGRPRKGAYSSGLQIRNCVRM